MSGFDIVTEQATRSDVVDVQPRWRYRAAVVAGVAVAIKRLCATNLPQYSSAQCSRRAVDVAASLVRMDAHVLIPARGRTEAMRLFRDAAGTALKRVAAVFAGLHQGRLFSWTVAAGCSGRHFGARFSGPSASLIRRAICVRRITGLRTVATPAARFFTRPNPNLFLAAWTRQPATSLSRWQCYWRSSAVRFIYCCSSARLAAIATAARWVIRELTFAIKTDSNCASAIRAGVIKIGESSALFAVYTWQVLIISIVGDIR